MSDIIDSLTDAALAIQSDKVLKSLFIKILENNGQTQQQKVYLLLLELEKTNAPDEIKNIVRYFINTNMADIFLKTLKS
jgi:hypothetical protein